jgi:hypothetical protein
MVNLKRTKFKADDVELLASVIEVIPNLTEVAHATKLVRTQLTYPIDNRASLMELFAGKKSMRLGQRSITLTQIERFLPENFFPIESERDLICRLLIAFQIGDIYHAEELIQKQLAQPISSKGSPVELLPGPDYQPGRYLSLRTSRKENQ